MGGVEPKSIHAGPSIWEVCWWEMDRIMEGLMTKTDAEDGGDKYRAQGLAFALAVFDNPSAPDVAKVRREAVARWKRSQEEKPHANDDQDDAMTRPEGADQ